MESSAAGGEPRPSPSGGASPSPPTPPPPPPPPPGGWLAGIVSGAGRLLAVMLGPDSSQSGSGSGSGSAATAALEGASPSASSSPGSCRPHGCNGGTDHGDSPLFPLKNNQLIQSSPQKRPQHIPFRDFRGGKDLKDYAEISLAIVSDIEPKDAIMQLLMQETYSRTECSTLIKIIQERVVNSDSGGIVDGELALPISQKADRQPTVGYSSFTLNISSPATSSPQIHGNGFHNGAAAGAAPTLTPADQGFLSHNANKIQSVFKRSYSVAEDTPENLRRVRPKINGYPLNISKFKQIDIIRNRPDASSREKLNAKNHNAFEVFSGDDNKLLSDAPLLGTNNLASPNIISKVESADGILDVPNKPSAVPSQRFDSSSSQDRGDQKTYDSSFLNSCSNKDLKHGLPLRVEPLDAFIPFKHKMVDLSHQKHEHAACNDSCSVSKLMFMEDIEAAPSLPMSVQLQNGSKNRRRKQSNSERPTLKTTGSPAKGTRRKNNDVAIKSEDDLPEQNTLAVMEEDPDHVPEKRSVGRPRKGR